MRLFAFPVILLIAAAAFADPFGPPVRITSEIGVPSLTYVSDRLLVVWRNAEGVEANGRTIASGAVDAAIDGLNDEALVVWTEANGRVRGQRVSAIGNRIGSPITIGTNAAGVVAVAAGIDRYLIAWPSTLGDIYASVVDANGTRIIPPAPISTQQTSAIDGIEAASLRDTFAVVWSADSAVFATTLNDLAVPASMTPISIAGNAQSPDITASPFSFFIVWNDTPQGIRGRSLFTDGTLGRVLPLVAGYTPRVEWDGFAYTVAHLTRIVPRPGFSFEARAAERFTIGGAMIESLNPAFEFFPTTWDIAAREGRVDLVAAHADGLTLETATVGPPSLRPRVVRH